MHDSISKLLRVQDLDSQILFMREAFRVRPSELDDDRQKLSRAQEAVTVMAGKIKGRRMAADQRELDVKKFDEEITKFRVALNQTKSNAEYSVMRDSIERQTEDRGKAEEEVLEILAEIDVLQDELRESESYEAAVRKSFDRKSAEISELIKGLEEQVNALEEDRRGRVEGVDPEHLRLYERVLERHRNHAIAPVEDGVCRGCNMRVTPQNINRLMLSYLVQCTQCTRFLYLS
ncbi:MAG: hypothetical protein MK538_03000 [Planctomycetes bacterium]|nr:hypothetical protein [Planctomycetota bacterium]